MTVAEANREQAGRIAAIDLGFEVDGARLLADVSVSVGRGGLVGLIGPNGAGKSTLLRAMARLTGGTTGTVAIEGVDATKIRTKEVARRLAFVAQHAPDTHGFTALEVVLTGRYPHLGRFEVEGQRDQAIALQAMERTETVQFAERIASSLSGGERQRLFLARGLAQATRILLLDEPTASLDVRHQFAVMDLARELAASGITVVTAIHDLRMAARYCDRLVLLDDGRVIADGAPVEVLTAPNLRAVFGVHASVFSDPVSGRLAVEFESDARAGEAGYGALIHVIGGGGFGAPVVRELTRAGYRVTMGPLGMGDIDRVACDAAGVPYLHTAGFSPIDDGTHERHISWVARADCAVLCEIPVGAGNLRNLEAVRAARRLVSIESGPFARRDYTGGAAEAVFNELRVDGRCSAPDGVAAAVPAALESASATTKSGQTEGAVT